MGKRSYVFVVRISDEEIAVKNILCFINDAWRNQARVFQPSYGYLLLLRMQY
jgi:hypothetical protein